MRAFVVDIDHDLKSTYIAYKICIMLLAGQSRILLNRYIYAKLNQSDNKALILVF